MQSALPMLECSPLMTYEMADPVKVQPKPLLKPAGVQPRAQTGPRVLQMEFQLWTAYGCLSGHRISALVVFAQTALDDNHIISQ